MVNQLVWEQKWLQTEKREKNPNQNERESLRENRGENSEVQRDNWAVRNKGVERGLQRLCVCVCMCLMKDFSFLTNTLFWSVCVWGRLSLCAVPPRSPVRVRPIVRWQSRRASCRYALSHREYLIQQHMNTHTHTSLGDFPWDGEHRGGHSQRERVKVRAYSSLPTNSNLTFSGF